jgi:hypothetical protein
LVRPLPPSDDADYERIVAASQARAAPRFAVALAQGEVTPFDEVSRLAGAI